VVQIGLIDDIARTIDTNQERNADYRDKKGLRI